MRREFTRAMTLVKHQREEMYARDELTMATTRIRVRQPHEVALGGLPDPIPEHLRASVVHEWELDDMEQGYVADRAVYVDDLRKAKSQVRFLERLKDDDAGENKKLSDANKEEAAGAFECPVCVEEVGRISRRRRARRVTMRSQAVRPVHRRAGIPRAAPREPSGRPGFSSAQPAA